MFVPTMRPSYQHSEDREVHLPAIAALDNRRGQLRANAPRRPLPRPQAHDNCRLQKSARLLGSWRDHRNSLVKAYQFSVAGSFNQE